MISIYLDGNIINSTPIEIKELSEIIERDDSLKCWIHKFDDTELTFSGDGYNYIKSKKDELGYNYRIEVQIVVSPDIASIGPGDVIKGYVYLTDIEINHTTREIKCQLIETYAVGTLKQNQKVESNLREVWTSMNGTTNNIAAYAPVTRGIRLFDPEDGVYDGNLRYGVSLVEAIEFIVKYITDDGMDFQDNYFSVGWPTTYFNLVTGRELRTFEHLDSDKPKENFLNLINNTYKIFGVWYYIDYSSYKPVFVLDHYDNIYNSNETPIRFDNVKNVKESFNQNDFFTDVEIGTKIYQKPQGSDDYWLPFFNGFTHHFESFHGKNNTMTSQTLDLVVEDWIMDHNIITDVFKNGAKDWDDDLFLIECENDGVTDDPAIAYTYGLLEAATERRYNENLLNSNRLARFTLPVNVGFDSGITNDNFEALSSVDQSTTATTPIEPVLFSNEILDPNNNYSTVTSRYTAPITGNYGFTTRLPVVIEGLLPGFVRRFQIWIYQRYASTTFKTFKSKTFEFSTNTGPEGFIMEFSHNMIMAATDTMEIWLIVQDPGNLASTYNILTGAQFYTTYVQNQGGLVTGETNIGEYFGGVLEFEYPIPVNTWKELKNNSVSDIEVTIASERMALTKIRSINRNILTGMASFELITKGNKVGL